MGRHLNSKSQASKKSARFWNKIARKYSQQPIKDNEAYAFKLEKTQSYFPPKAKILEFGCGTGTTALHHAAKVDHILAIDSAPKMIEIARKKLNGLGLNNVTFEVASIEDMAPGNNAYDIVLGMSVLHLLPDPQAVICEVHKRLKPGGIFISSTHCVGDKTPWVRWLVPAGQFLNIMPFVKIFTKSDLKTWLSNAGFDIEFEWAAARSPSTIFLISKANTDQSTSTEGHISGAQSA